MLVNPIPHNPVLMLQEILEVDTFENKVGKGENAGDHHFLCFQQHFLPLQRQKSLHLPHYQTTKFWTGPNSKHLQTIK